MTRPLLSPWQVFPNMGLNGEVDAIAYEGGDIYAGGFFTGTADGSVTNLNHIARLSGGAWSALPHQGLDSTVLTLAVDGNGALYAGGFFLETFDHALTTVNYIAKFSGGAWEALPNDGLNSSVTASAIHNGTLYAGGNFGGTSDGAQSGMLRIARLVVELDSHLYLPLVKR